MDGAHRVPREKEENGMTTEERDAVSPLADANDWVSVDGVTYHWFNGAWWEVEYYGTASNQYRHVRKV